MPSHKRNKLRLLTLAFALIVPPVACARTYAVIVGVSKYKTAGVDWLKYANRDADLFNSWVRANRAGAEVRLIEEDKATLASVREAVIDVLDRASARDEVFLFFSGRGLGTPDYRPGFILTSESNETRPSSNALSTDDIGLYLRQSRAGQIFLYADVRASERLQRNNLVQLKLGDMRMYPRAGNDRGPAREKQELSALVGTQPKQLSAELDEVKYGAFAFFLEKGLRSGAKDLFEYLKQELPKGSTTHQSPLQFGRAATPPKLTTRMRGRSPARVINAMWAPGPDPQAQADALHEELMNSVADPRRAYDIFNSAAPDQQERERGTLAVAMEDEGQKVLVAYGEGNQFPDEPERPGRSEFARAALAFEVAGKLHGDQRTRESLEARALFSEGRAMLFDAHAEADFDKAIEKLTASGKKRDDYPESFNAIGIAQLERARYSQAATAFLASIERAPDWAYPRHNLALTYVEMGDYAAAEREYREAIRRTPHHPYLYYNLAVLLHRINRKADAKVEYNRAVTVFRAQAKLAAEHENGWRVEGNPKEAQRAEQRQQTLQKNEAEAHNALGALAQAQGNLKVARLEYQKSRELDHNLLLASYNMGVLEARKNPDRAVDLLQEVTAQDPSHLPARLKLGEIFGRQGKFEEAANQYREAARIRPDSEAAARLPETLGDLAATKGQTAESCAQYRQAEKAGPENRKALAKKMSRVCR